MTVAYRFSSDERSLLLRMKGRSHIWVIERNRQDALRKLVAQGFATCHEGSGEDRGLLIGSATAAGHVVDPYAMQVGPATVQPVPE